MAEKQVVGNDSGEDASDVRRSAAAPRGAAPAGPRPPMLLPQTAQYALRAMAWLSRAPDGEPVRTRELSAGTGIPGHYLSKVLRRLVLAGLLVSQKGQGGGFSLARPPGEITFGEILDAVDALPSPGHCAFGWGACNAEDPCPLHATWSQLSDAVVRWASTTTLAEVGEIPVEPRSSEVGAGNTGGSGAPPG